MWIPWTEGLNLSKFPPVTFQYASMQTSKETQCSGKACAFHLTQKGWIISNHNDPDFSRSNVFCWCKSTRFQCMRIILFRFQHPEPTGSYRYAVFFSPGPTFSKAHRWHSIKREDKAGKKTPRDQDPSPWLPMLPMGFDHRFWIVQPIFGVSPFLPPSEPVLAAIVAPSRNN